MLWEEGVCYDQCILLAKLYQPFPCFILSSKAKVACYSRGFLTSYFCIPVPFMKMTSFLVVSSKRSCGSSQNHFSFFSITGHYIDLNYHDVKWFALETNRDHSVIFEIASKYCILESFVTMVATPFLLRDSCP